MKLSFAQQAAHRRLGVTALPEGCAMEGDEAVEILANQRSHDRLAAETPIAHDELLG